MRRDAASWFGQKQRVRLRDERLAEEVPQHLVFATEREGQRDLLVGRDEHARLHEHRDRRLERDAAAHLDDVRPRRHGARLAADDAHAVEIDDGVLRLRQRLHRVERVRLGRLLLRQRVPRGVEVGDRQLRDVVGDVHGGLVDGELLGLADLVVALLLQREGAALRDGARGERLGLHLEHHVRALRLARADRVDRDREERFDLELGDVGLHDDVLEARVVHRVRDLVLQHDAVAVDVLDQRDDVLAVALGDELRLDGVQRLAELAQLRDLPQAVAEGLELGARDDGGGAAGAARRVGVGGGLLRRGGGGDGRDLGDVGRVGRGAEAGRGAVDLLARAGDLTSDVRDERADHVLVIGGEHLGIERRAVAHVVVRVVGGAREQRADARAQRGVGSAELGERRDADDADGGLVEHDAVVDVAQVLVRVGRVRALLADHRKNAVDDGVVLAVLDVLTQAEQRELRRVAVRLDERHERLDDDELEVGAAVLPERVVEEADERRVLVRELGREDLQRVDDDHLAILRELRDEAADDGQDAVDVELAARLEQRRHGERADGAVRVVDHRLELEVARRDDARMVRRDAVQQAHRGEAEDAAVRVEVQLEHEHRGLDLLVADAADRREGLGGLEHDNVAAVVRHVVDEAVQLRRRGEVLLHQLGAELDDEAQRERRADRPLARLLDELEHAHAVVLAHLVQQRERVVLRAVAAVLGHLAHLGAPPLHHLGLHAREVDARDERGGDDGVVLVNDGLLEEALHGAHHGRVGHLAQRPDRVAAVHLLGAVDVAHERRRRDEDLLGDAAEVLQQDEEQAAQLLVLRLEQLRAAEEDLGGLVGAQGVARRQQVQHAHDGLAALARVDGDGAELAALLQHGRLLDPLEGHEFFLFLVHRGWVLSRGSQ
mmetsp:Transcript_26912/g.83262  ORF Transcript_26912/g.83262 Transcript_26912/m.83262 type:complete len:893 (-) Transcript_26912:18-2696(-)